MTTNAGSAAIADPEARIDALLQALTLAEKVALLAGAGTAFALSNRGGGCPAKGDALKVEGTKGAALLSMGVNLEYPQGLPDTLEIARDGEWDAVPLRGSWFTEAFEGPMSNLQRFVTGEVRMRFSRGTATAVGRRSIRPRFPW